MSNRQVELFQGLPSPYPKQSGLKNVPVFRPLIWLNNNKNNASPKGFQFSWELMNFSYNPLKNVLNATQKGVSSRQKTEARDIGK